MRAERCGCAAACCPPCRLIVSIPLSYSGGMLAAKQEIKPYPTRTNQIPRHIPPPHWASHPIVLFFAAGLLPFGTIFVELYFAMTSLWQVRAGQGCQVCSPNVEL